MKCEICGGDLHSEGTLIEVEGAELTVCDRCRRFGQETKEHPKLPHSYPKTLAVKTLPRMANRKVKPKLVREQTPKRELEEHELVEDYPQQIRRTRESLRVSQTDLARRIGERLSIIQKLETGKMWPSDSLVDKIERTLHIKLRAPLSDDLVLHQREKPKSELTIGDIAETVVRKKES